MSKTIEIRKAIHKTLSEIYPNIFYSSAKGGTNMPYVTYKLGSYGPTGYLELNFWDNSSDSTRIETIADTFEKELNKLVINNETLTVSLFFNHDRQLFPDEDKTVIHLVCNFKMIYYGSEES